MSRSSVRIVGVSDVSVGYGSPQVAAMMGSLGGFYGSKDVVLFEPDQLQRPARPNLFPELRMFRIPTTNSHFSTSGSIEYLNRVAHEIDRLKPDVLLVTSPYCTPLLVRIRRKPPLVIYYMLESLSYYSDGDAEAGRFILDFHRNVLPDAVDIVVFPEENRAAHDIEAAGFHRQRVALVYNCVNTPVSVEHAVPSRDRFRCALYTGTIQRGLSCAEHFLEPSVQDIPIHLYGLIEGPDKDDLRKSLAELKGSIRYVGYVDARTLCDMRRMYAYSLVMWAPTSRHVLWAAPNKFFEAIADGVPPIAAPHPQCKLLVDRYQCGLLMDDWSFPSFQQTLRAAFDLLGTEAYLHMIEGCRRAVESELNWEEQFRRVAACLPPRDLLLKLPHGGPRWA